MEACYLISSGEHFFLYIWIVSDVAFILNLFQSLGQENITDLAGAIL